MNLCHTSKNKSQKEIKILLYYMSFTIIQINKNKIWPAQTIATP